MSKRAGLVVAVNLQRRIGVVRFDDDLHAVVSHDGERRLRVGDRIGGDFATEGPAVLQNITTGVTFIAHKHIVDGSAVDAETFAS